MKFLNQINSTVAEGTAPAIINSTTKIDNLNADLLDGLHSSSLELAITKGVDAPSAPINNALWIDTTTEPYVLKLYKSSSVSWIVIGGVGGGVTDHTLLTNIGTTTHANIDLKIAKYDNDITLLKNPTGFTNNSNIIVTYDSTGRTITLTGTFEGYYRGVKVTALTNGWVSDPHPETLDKTYFLKYNGTAFVFDENQWTFDNIQIAVVQYGTLNKIALKETHGFMTWETHFNLHNTVGAYKSAGGTLTTGSWSAGSTTAANRRPLVDQTTIYDEDLKHEINALTTETYTQKYLVGSGAVRTFVLGASDILPVTGATPYYNQYTGGAWQQTPMSNNDYAAVWLTAIPVTNDAGSQSYRYIWTQPQTVSTTLATIRALSPSDINIGESTALVSEFVFTVKIIIRMASNNWTITEVQNLTGNRFNQTGSPQGVYLTIVASDATITGDGTSATPLAVATPLVYETSTTNIKMDGSVSVGVLTTVARADHIHASDTTKKTDSMTTNKLLGRATADTGVIEEITLGTGLSFTGTTLNSSGSNTGAVIKREEFIATAGQTLFTLTLGSYVQNNNTINIFIQGIKQPPESYTETSTTSFTFDSGLEVGDLVLVEWYQDDPSIKGEDGYTPIKGVDYFDGTDGAGVLEGGTTGQILTKKTNDNYDTEWKDVFIISSSSTPPASVVDGTLWIDTSSIPYILKCYNLGTTEWIVVGSIGGGSAETTTYDNTTSGLIAENVQAAIDEVYEDSITTIDEVLTGALPRDADTLGGELPSYYSLPSGFGAGVGINSIIEGQYSVALTTAAHAGGQYNLACHGVFHKITAFDNTLKTITLDNVTGLIVTDLLQIKITGVEALKDVPITEINGLVVTLNTTATITSSWLYAIEKISTTMYPAYVEGRNSMACGDVSHAEGSFTVASGSASHAQNRATTASGQYSHAEGYTTIASGQYSHAEGYVSVASAYVSHAEGSNTTASGTISHAEGELTVASGGDSHAEGYRTISNGMSSHAEGTFTNALTNYAHTEGFASMACEGITYKITAFDNILRKITLDNVTGLIVGDLLQIKIAYSPSAQNASITEINGLIVTLNVTGTMDSAWTYAIKKSDSMEGSHAEGSDTMSSGNASHSEGTSTIASGESSHAEGSSTMASGLRSHSEGWATKSIGSYSHSANEGTTAQGYDQTTIGRYNILQGTSESFVSTDQAFIIGNGTNDSTRSNAMTVDWQGNTVLSGTLVTTGTPTESQTISYTLGITNRGKLQKCNSSSAIVVTIPLNTFAIDTEIVFVRYGTGAVSFTPISGVTLNSSASKRSITNQYEAVTLKLIATNEWLLLGSLSA